MEGNIFPPFFEQFALSEFKIDYEINRKAPPDALTKDLKARLRNATKEQSNTSFRIYHNVIQSYLDSLPSKCLANPPPTSEQLQYTWNELLGGFEKIADDFEDESEAHEKPLTTPSTSLKTSEFDFKGSSDAHNQPSGSQLSTINAGKGGTDFQKNLESKENYEGIDDTKQLNKLIESGVILLNDLPVTSYDLDPIVYTSSEEDEPYNPSQALQSQIKNRFPPLIQDLRSTLRSIYRHCKSASLNYNTPPTNGEASGYIIKTSAMKKRRNKYRIYRRSLQNALQRLHKKPNLLSTTQQKNSSNINFNSLIDDLQNVYIPHIESGFLPDEDIRSQRKPTLLVDFFSNIIEDFQSNNYRSLSLHSEIYNSTFYKRYTFNYRPEKKFYMAHAERATTLLHNGSYRSTSLLSEIILWLSGLSNGYYPLYIDSNHHKKRKKWFVAHPPSSSNSRRARLQSLSGSFGKSPGNFSETSSFKSFGPSVSPNNSDFSPNNSEMSPVGSEVARIGAQMLSASARASPQNYQPSPINPQPSPTSSQSSGKTYSRLKITKTQIAMDIDPDSTESEGERAEREWDLNNPTDETINNVITAGVSNNNQKKSNEERNTGQSNEKSEELRVLEETEISNQLNILPLRKRKYSTNHKNFSYWDCFSSSEESDIVYFQDDRQFRYRKQKEIAEYRKRNKFFHPSSLSSKRGNSYGSIGYLSMQDNFNTLMMLPVQHPQWGKKDMSWDIQPPVALGRPPPNKKHANESLLKNFKKVYRKNRVRNLDTKHVKYNNLSEAPIFGLVATGIDPRGVHTHLVAIDNLVIHQQFHHSKLYTKTLRNTPQPLSIRREYMAVIDEVNHTITLYSCGTVQLHFLPSPHQALVEKAYKNVLFRPPQLRWREALYYKQLFYMHVKEIDAFLTKNEIRSFQQALMDVTRLGLRTLHKPSPVSEFELEEWLKSNTKDERNFTNSNKEWWKVALERHNSFFYTSTFNISNPLKQTTNQSDTQISTWSSLPSTFHTLLQHALKDGALLQQYIHYVYPIFVKRYLYLRSRYAIQYKETQEANRSSADLQRTKEVNATQVDETLVKQQLKRFDMHTKAEVKPENIDESGQIKEEDSYKLQVEQSLPKFDPTATTPETIYDLYDVLPIDVLMDDSFEAYPLDCILNGTESKENISQTWSPTICNIVELFTNNSSNRLRLLSKFDYTWLSRILKILQWLIVLCRIKDLHIDQDDDIDYLIQSRLSRLLKSNIQSIKEAHEIPISFISWIKARFYSEDHKMNNFMSRQDETRLISSITWICAFLSPDWTFDYEYLLIQEWENKLTNRFFDICLLMGFTKSKIYSSKFTYALTQPPSIQLHSKTKFDQFTNLFATKPSNYASGLHFRRRPN